MLAGIDIRHIPYKGGGPALNDLVGGHVSMGFGSIASTQPFVKQGKIRMIAITSAKRSPAAPDVPTIGETVKGYEMTPWNAMFAPKGTSPAIIASLNAAAIKALDDETVKKRLLELGSVIPGPKDRTPEALATLVKNEIAKWTPVLKPAS